MKALPTLAILMTLVIFLGSALNGGPHAEGKAYPQKKIDDPACDDNIRPSVPKVELLVNDEIVDQPVTLKTSDSLKIRFEYFDEDCNLIDVEGLENELPGSLIIASDWRNEATVTDDTWSRIYFNRWFLPDSTGCSSNENGPEVIEINPSRFLIPDGETKPYPYFLRIDDACGGASTPYHFLDFTVVLDDADDDDGSADDDDTTIGDDDAFDSNDDDIASDDDERTCREVEAEDGKVQGGCGC